jgi:hypothetical protein
MMVFISDGKTTCFGPKRPSSGFDNFLAIRVIYNMHKPRFDVQISSSLPFAHANVKDDEM